MKQLSDTDIEQMSDGVFIPDDAAARKSVRAELKLSKRIPAESSPLPKQAVLDLHQHTEEQAWNEIMNLANSGVRQATIITGASGVLRVKFPQWATESILAPHILSAESLNNGSFSVKFKKQKN